MMDIELTAPLPAINYDGYRRVWVLGRLHTEPIGTCMLDVGEDGLTGDQLGVLLWSKFSKPVRERFAEAGLLEPSGLSGSGLEADPTSWPFLRDRLAILASAPFISVVICTRDRPDHVETCLRFLAQQEYPRYEVVVVDNVPATGALRTLVEASQGDGRFRYVLEPRPGVMWARNTGIAAASGEIIAFLDDDEEPDRYWLAGLACGFSRGDYIGCVTGMVIPARLDTQAQELFEQLGGHVKGRGFSSEIFFSPRFPEPALPSASIWRWCQHGVPAAGTYAHWRFRRRTGRGNARLCGRGHSGPDASAPFRILHRLQPAALMRHHHRRDLDGLALQLHGYGVGLTAYYAALLRSSYCAIRTPEAGAHCSWLFEGRDTDPLHGAAWPSGRAQKAATLVDADGACCVYQECAPTGPGGRNKSAARLRGALISADLVDEGGSGAILTPLRIAFHTGPWFNRLAVHARSPCA